MPEGPSILILKELALPLKGKKIIKAKGNAKIDMALLPQKRIKDIRTWGKQFFICLEGDLTIRIHFLMFGSYEFDKHTKLARSLRLGLWFSKGAIFFNTCAVKYLEGKLEDLYDWEADVLSDRWNPGKAKKKLKAMKGVLVCDALLDQQLFSGVGNIIKNEVLYRIKLHPETKVENIPARKLTQLIQEARQYSFDFLKWKKAFVLKKHWLAHTKKTCLRCDLPLIKKYCGTTKRRTFFCENCQLKYKKLS